RYGRLPEPLLHRSSGRIRQSQSKKAEPWFRRRPPSSTRAGDAILGAAFALIGIRPRRPLRRCVRHQLSTASLLRREELLLRLLGLLCLLRFLRHAALQAVKWLAMS